MSASDNNDLKDSSRANFSVANRFTTDVECNPRDIDYSHIKELVGVVDTGQAVGMGRPVVLSRTVWAGRLSLSSACAY